MSNPLPLSPIGAQVTVPAHDYAGVVLSYRKIGQHRVLTIETKTGDRVDVPEAECVFADGRVVANAKPASDAANQVTGYDAEDMTAGDVSAIARYVVDRHRRKAEVTLTQHQIVLLADAVLQWEQFGKSLSVASRRGSFGGGK